jgi:thioredoxin reductase/bacterioferritin-associated ferredoxin
MSRVAPTPLTVVGAGPAGITAAYTAAETGVHVTVLDENAFPGGQYYRQSPMEFGIADPVAAHSGHPEARTLYAQLTHPRITFFPNVLVWGVFDGRQLGLADGERTFLLETDRVVVATGAYDRPLAFPGWTLPGILGAGATLRLVKTQWVLPGRRVLLAGLGPLQLVLAHLLLTSGARVVCVADAANPWGAWRQARDLWGHWDRLRAAYAYRRTLWRHRVPLLFNHAIVAAEGTERVEAATLARLDAQGVPIAGTERIFDVDAVCLGYGLLPSLQLTAAFGCELRYDESLRWFVPRHDDQMGTSVPGVFVAGDVTDPGGAPLAVAEGRVAGLAAAHQLGCLDARTLRQALTPAQAERRRLARLAGALQRIYAFRPGLAHLAQPTTVVCRCEEVSRGAVEAALAAGATDLHQIKLRSRVGMGYCQGRICAPLIAPIVARSTGQPLSAVRPCTTRPPVQPIKLGALAAAEP